MRRQVSFIEVDCVVDGQLVGRRSYTPNGILVMEEPLRNGIVHGRKYWCSPLNGSLDFMEPYVDGKAHGIAKQYGERGKVIGTYRMVHGTGYDIWKEPDLDEDGNPSGAFHLAELNQMEDGVPHGIEWWLNPDGTLWWERSWKRGKLHGIERMWNSSGNLRHGFPKYWIGDEKVSKRKYLKLQKVDFSCPPFRAEDNKPQRLPPPGLRMDTSPRPTSKALS
ncbi:MAG: hypothetical protein HUU16_19595 [Candidatus Omnitrophica bacterium]|nr:hypothetical protein [Candidatus Omnitrophota bacterium]